MPVTFNIRHLEEKVLRLKGELPVEDLDLAGTDELIHAQEPLSYDLEVERFERAILAQGKLEIQLECECARCLRRYPFSLVLDPWACHLALEGDEKVPIVNDSVDLTGYMREDILLALPQHPLCDPECKGLVNNLSKPGAGRKPEEVPAAWAELNKLKF